MTYLFGYQRLHRVPQSFHQPSECSSSSAFLEYLVHKRISGSGIFFPFQPVVKAWVRSIGPVPALAAGAPHHFLGNSIPIPIPRCTPLDECILQIKRLATQCPLDGISTHGRWERVWHGPGAAEVDNLAAHVIERVDVAHDDAQFVEVFQIIPYLRYLFGGEWILGAYKLLDDGADGRMEMFYAPVPKVDAVLSVFFLRVFWSCRPFLDLSGLPGCEKQISVSTGGEIFTTFLLKPPIYAALTAERVEIVAIEPGGRETAAETDRGLFCQIVGGIEEKLPRSMSLGLFPL